MAIVLEEVIVKPEESSNIEKADGIAGYLGYLGLIPFKAPYVGFLASNPSLITSLGVLVDNHKKGTASGQDYIHATLSLAGFATGVLGLAVFGGATTVLTAAPIFGITLGIAVLDYLNSEYYDDVVNYVTEIKSHLNGLLDELFNEITENQQNKHESWENLSPEEQAQWIKAGGLPWDYDPNAKNLNELLGNIDLGLIDDIKKQMGIASQITSPIILDLDGDGKVETTGKILNFDHDNNGFAELTAWVGADDGLLIYDKNNNGQIDDGTELFGNNTILSNGKKATNGFEALKDFDKNSDGKIDKNDEIYSQLKVWQDKNQNGKVENNFIKFIQNSRFYKANLKLIA